MKFRAFYYCRNAPGEYYRTVYGDTLNEATKYAEKYCKKGYLLLSVIEA